MERTNMKIYFCEKCGISIPLQEVVGGRATARDGKTYCQACLPDGPPDAGDLKLYFCDNCKVSIPLQDVITNRAKTVGTQMLCVDCSRLNETQRQARRDRIQQDIKEKEESRYRLHFCDSCHTSIPQSHLITGRAVIRGGRTFCERCRGRADRRKGSAASTVLVILLLGVVFLGGYLVLGGQGLLSRTEPVKEGPSEAELMHEKILKEVNLRIEKRIDESLSSFGEIQSEVDRLAESQADIRRKYEALNDFTGKSLQTQAADSVEMEDRLEKLEQSIRDSSDGIAALSNKLDEYRREAARAAREAAAAKPEPKAGPTPGAGDEPAPPPAEEIPPEVAAWIAQLEDDDPGVRFSAAVELGKTGVKAAAAPLMKVLEKDKDTFVRRAAARSLGDLDAWIAVPTLIETLKDREFFVAITAHNALEKITGQDFGFKEGLSKSEQRKVVSKAKDWWEKHEGDRTE